MLDETNLTSLVTQWTRVFRAQSAGDSATEARQDLLVRYRTAVLRYLRDKLRDDHAADQIFSNFVVRVLEGDAFLKRADPERGRFRDYLKTILRNMVADHYREKNRENRKRSPLLPGDDREPVASDSALLAEDQRFLSCWRQELINQVWETLGQAEKRTGQPYATLMRLQDEQPDLRSGQLAERLSARLGRPITAVGVRKLLQRGRSLFADLLVAEVARSLEVDPADPAGADCVEAELIALKLLFSYCKSALERCKSGV